MGAASLFEGVKCRHLRLVCGAQVSVDGDTIVVGTSTEAPIRRLLPTATPQALITQSAGAAYVYVRNGDTWSQQAYLKASNAEAADEFSEALTFWKYDSGRSARGRLFADIIIYRRGGKDDNSIARAGAVYVFVREGDNWRQEAYLKSSNNDNTNLNYNDFFGTSVALENDTLAVEPVARIQVVHQSFMEPWLVRIMMLPMRVRLMSFRESGLWSQQAYLRASNAESEDFFGTEIGISGGTIVVSATGEDSNQTTITNGPTASDDNSLSSSGAVYVFRSWEAECGNGIVDQGEDCDDGNANDDGDGCSETCVFNPYAVTELYSLFLRPAMMVPVIPMPEYSEQCNSTCDGQKKLLGDGIKNGSEQCDDANLSYFDGCSKLLFLHD